jgi:hypothetical protein
VTRSAATGVIDNTGIIDIIDSANNNINTVDFFFIYVSFFSPKFVSFLFVCDEELYILFPRRLLWEIFPGRALTAAVK